MSDLVKRLRELGDEPQDVSLGEIAEWSHKAADRIEQIERELRVYMDAAEGHLVERMRQLDELTAEKALADRLAVALSAVWRFPMKSSDIEAYRKARGL